MWWWMNKDLVAAAKALHDTLMAGIAKCEAMANDCAQLADLAEQDGHVGYAEGLRDLNRNHRIEGLELSTRLALLKAECRDLRWPEA